jgi:hypothetical protein
VGPILSRSRRKLSGPDAPECTVEKTVWNVLYNLENRLQQEAQAPWMQSVIYNQVYISGDFRLQEILL